MWTGGGTISEGKSVLDAPLRVIVFEYRASCHVSRETWYIWYIACPAKLGSKYTWLELLGFPSTSSASQHIPPLPHRIFAPPEKHHSLPYVRFPDSA